MIKRTNVRNVRLLKMSGLNRILAFSFSLYIAALLTITLTGFKEEIPVYMFVMQLVITIVYFSMVYFCTRLEDIQNTSFVVFVIFLILSVMLRYVFIQYTGDPYNHTIGADVYKYEKAALMYHDIDYFAFLNKILNKSFFNFNIDDIGYNSISYFAHRFSSDVHIGRWLLVGLNSLSILISTICTYRICRFIHIEERIAIVSAALYGLFPFFAVSSAMGLKENCFCLIIVLAIYYMYKYKVENKFVSLILALLFIGLTFFFRSVITLMLLLTLIPLFYCNEHTKKKAIYWGIIGAILLGGVLPILILSFTGNSMEHVSRVTEARLQGTGDSTGQRWLVQVVSAFIGPFPNFTRAGQYGILYNSGLLLKCILGYFVYTGIYQSIRQLNYKLYPLIAYLLMGYVMLVGSGVALDMRYHVTFWVTFVILSAYGMQSGCVSKCMYTYSLGCIAVIILYNLR